MRLLSLSSIARVKRGAESALERFEELPKEVISVFLLGVHYSHSLTETCRIWILRLVSKSQRSCYDSKVLSAYWSELGNTLNFIFKFLPFLLYFAPARALLHVLSHLAYFPPLPPSSLFATTMVCASLSPSMFEGWPHCTHEGLGLW
jgi:hypothetical protein